MIPLLIVLLPAMVGGYTVVITPTLLAVYLAIAATALCVCGALLRRYALIVAGAWVLMLGYVGSLVTAGRPLEIWPSAGVGIGVFLILELGYDWVSAFRAVVGRRAYSLRLRALARTAGVALAGVFVVSTLALSIKVHTHLEVKPYGMALAALGVICAVAVPLAYLVHRDAVKPEARKRS